LHRAAEQAAAAGGEDPVVTAALEEARWRLLRGETSCNIFWGEAWCDRAQDDLEVAARAIEDAERRLGPPED